MSAAISHEIELFLSSIAITQSLLQGKLLVVGNAYCSRAVNRNHDPVNDFYNVPKF